MTEQISKPLSVVQFSTEKPPVYEQCEKQFGVDWDMGVIICFGNVIHCVNPVAPHKLAHELVHVEQQTNIGRDKWWYRYFTDPKFRLVQEVEAYRMEVKWLKQNLKDRERRARMIHHCCVELSRGYGDIVKYSDARIMLGA